MYQNYSGDYNIRLNSQSGFALRFAGAILYRNIGISYVITLPEFDNYN